MLSAAWPLTESAHKHPHPLCAHARTHIHILHATLCLSSYSRVRASRANADIDMDKMMSSGATPQRAQSAVYGGGAGAGGDWGWYSPYPTSRFEGSIALHYLVPLMNLCVRCILPKTTLGLSSVAALPDMMVGVMRICVRVRVLVLVRVLVRVRASASACACVTEGSSHQRKKPCTPTDPRTTHTPGAQRGFKRGVRAVHAALRTGARGADDKLADA